jgi:protein involved in polysaccharide export with SLBB domain
LSLPEGVEQRAIVTLLLLLLSTFGLTGCGTPKSQFNALEESKAIATQFIPTELTNRLDSTLLQPPTEPFRLGPGDRLEVEILGESGSRATTVVGPDGRIYFYLLPGLDVWGLTMTEARELMQREVRRLVPDAQISLILRGIESQRVWLLGRLQSAGVYPLGTPTTLLESISTAGGPMNTLGSLEEIADLQRSFIVRNGEPLPVDFERLLRNGDMSQNVYLHGGDFVYLPSAIAHDIHVLGAVRSPRPVPFVRDLTLISAIASTGGTIKDAYLTHVAIVRGSLSQPRIAVVDYKAVILGNAPDVRLESRDIIYVPFSPYRTLTKYVDLILTTFVRAVAINEGARAVSKDPAPVGLNIGITPR